MRYLQFQKREPVLSFHAVLRFCALSVLKHKMRHLPKHSLGSLPSKEVHDDIGRRVFRQSGKVPLVIPLSGTDAWQGSPKELCCL